MAAWWVDGDEIIVEGEEERYQYNSLQVAHTPNQRDSPVYTTYTVSTPSFQYTWGHFIRDTHTLEKV